MKNPSAPRFVFPAFFLPLLGLLASSSTARAEWQSDATSLAWRQGSDVIWKFSFDPHAGKPFFHPLTVGGSPSLTNFKPADHPWHYGLWFSWKYINHANYWEEDRTTGHAEGATRWQPPALTTRDDGSATIRLDLTYTHPSGRVDLTEQREITVSAPDGDGNYTIDWHARFTVGAEPVTLDRTAMPGEPNGQPNGGYAGLGARLMGPPLLMEIMTTHGLVTDRMNDRARPNAPAVACNFSPGEGCLGGIAILSDPQNAGTEAPWYLVDSKQMQFACAAILAPKPRIYEAGATFELRYRIALRRTGWTPAILRQAYAAWLPAAP